MSAPIRTGSWSGCATAYPEKIESPFIRRTWGLRYEEGWLLKLLAHSIVHAVLSKGSFHPSVLEWVGADSSVPCANYSLLWLRWLKGFGGLEAFPH